MPLPSSRELHRDILDILCDGPNTSETIRFALAKRRRIVPMGPEWKEWVNLVAFSLVELQAKGTRGLPIPFITKIAETSYRLNTGPAYAAVA